MHQLLLVKHLLLATQGLTLLVEPLCTVLHQDGLHTAAALPGCRVLYVTAGRLCRL